MALSSFGLWTLFHSNWKQSSVEETKHQLLLKSTSRFNDRHTDKVRGSLAAEIQLLSEVPLKIGDRFTVKGLVRSLETFTAVQTKWILSGNMELIQGTQEDQFAVGQDQSIEREIVLEVKSAGPLRLQFHARAEKGGAPVGAIGHWSNVPEVVLEKKSMVTGDSSSEENQAPTPPDQEKSETKKEPKVFH